MHDTFLLVVWAFKQLTFPCHNNPLADKDAVLWLEDYLSNWDKILFFVCHSQDFMNNVCTHIVRLDLTYKNLRYYSGNYDIT